MFASKLLSLLALSVCLLSMQVYASPLPPQYDPSTCFINESGFTTCNNRAEAPSNPKSNDLLGPSVYNGDSQSKGKFETVVDPDDFAFRTHFKEGKTVIIESQRQVAQPWQP
ncbi:hypothetical protein ABW20_dc0106923 [Dactylellina cionopaga]|nr:hypothetical protein ABW20_dc0106923 [Dactylellina cionopaga]